MQGRISSAKEQFTIFIKHYSRVEAQRCHTVYNGLQQLFIVVFMCNDSGGGGLLTEASARGEKAVPQSVTLTVVGALSFSRWREDKQLVFWVCCAGADNAGCRQSLIFPTATNPSWGRFNRYITTWFLLYPPRSVLLPVFLLGEQRRHTGISCLVSFS